MLLGTRMESRGSLVGLSLVYLEILVSCSSGTTSSNDVHLDNHV